MHDCHSAASISKPIYFMLSSYAQVISAKKDNSGNSQSLRSPTLPTSKLKWWASTPTVTLSTWLAAWWTVVVPKDVNFTLSPSRPRKPFSSLTWCQTSFMCGISYQLTIVVLGGNLTKVIYALWIIFNLTAIADFFYRIDIKLNRMHAKSVTSRQPSNLLNSEYQLAAAP